MKREAYDKSLQQFETAKAKKLNNINNQIILIETKINSLNYQLSELQKSLTETQRKNFPSFEELVKQSEEQSKIDKQKHQSALETMANY